MAELGAITETVKTATSTDKYGNKYSTAVSNDTLTNNDFLELLATQIKMQDPTKPMDSNAMLDNQVKMAQVQSNEDMSNALKSMQNSMSSDSLLTATNLMNKNVEMQATEKDKVTGELKPNPSMIVTNVEIKDGKVILNGNRITSIEDGRPVYDLENKSQVFLDDVIKIF